MQSAGTSTSRHVSATRSTNRDLDLPWLILCSLFGGAPTAILTNYPLGSVCILDNEVVVRYTAAGNAVQRHCAVQTRAGHVVSCKVT